MTDQEKVAIALASCDRHEREFGTKVPEGVRQFFREGAAFSVDGLCFPSGEDESDQVFSTVPSWEVLGQLGPLDDAVCGANGDWGHARRYLPIFAYGSCRFVVVDLEDGAVALYDEEEVGAKGSDYTPPLLSRSLAAFMKKLVEVEEPGDEAPDQDYIWEAAARNRVHTGQEAGDDDDADEMTPEKAWRIKLAEDARKLSFEGVFPGFDIFSMTTETTYCFQQDLQGNLWFAKEVKASPRDDVNLGAEVYKFDGETATRFVFKGNFVDGDQLGYGTHFACNAVGMVWFYRPAFSPVPPERPLFAFDRDNQVMSWGTHPVQYQLGPDREVRELDRGKVYGIVDQKTGKTLSKFETDADYGELQVAKNHIVINNSYKIECRSLDGKVEQVLQWSDLEAEPFFKGRAFDFLRPTLLDDTSLLVPFEPRHKKTATYLYVFDLKNRSFRPHRWNGLVKKGPAKCLFDRKGRLWAAHNHSPTSGFWTTFTVVDASGVTKIETPRPSRVRKKRAG